MMTLPALLAELAALCEALRAAVAHMVPMPGLFRKPETDGRLFFSLSRKKSRGAI